MRLEFWMVNRLRNTQFRLVSGNVQAQGEGCALQMPNLA